MKDLVANMPMTSLLSNQGPNELDLTVDRICCSTFYHGIRERNSSLGSSPPERRGFCSRKTLWNDPLKYPIRLQMIGEPTVPNY